MNKIWIGILLLAIAISCKKKPVSTVVKLKNQRKKQNIEVLNVDFEYLNTKSKLEYTDGLDNISAATSIRMKKDSIIWISISPLLGIEALRCVITKDSVKAMNKLQKEYYAYSYPELSQVLNFDVTFLSFQSLLLGNMPFKQSIEDSISTDSVYTRILQDRNKMEISNFIQNDSKQLENLRILDLKTNNTLSINYYNFKQLGSVLFPFVNKISLRYRSSKGLMNTYVGIEHNKVETSGEELKFPFSIPKKYEKK